ncbi:hypothetical protein MMC30_000743 [Trapelia coarctata]|nr:hypothetical protein [Trapelia coarctata]
MCIELENFYTCCGRYSSIYVKEPCANFEPSNGCLNLNVRREDLDLPAEVLCPYCSAEKQEGEEEGGDTRAGARDEMGGCKARGRAKQVDRRAFSSKKQGECRKGSKSKDNDQIQDARNDQSDKSKDEKTGGKVGNLLRRASGRVGRLVGGGGEPARQEGRR